MPTVPDQIEDAFIAKVRAIAAVKSVHDYEPQSLSPTGFPHVTLLWLAPLQEDYATGNLSEVTWRWRVNLYLSLGDWERAQQQLKDIGPEILKITRADPKLDNTADWSEINGLDDPVFALDDGYLVQTFRLEAKKEATGSTG